MVDLLTHLSNKADIWLLGAILLIYLYIWYSAEEDPEIDLELLVKSTRAGLTATSILLPGLILASRDLVSNGVIASQDVYYAALWLVISILFGVINLFRFPTQVVNSAVLDDDTDRLHFTDLKTIFYSLIQLSAIILGGVRVIIGLNLTAW